MNRVNHCLDNTPKEMRLENSGENSYGFLAMVRVSANLHAHAHLDPLSKFSYLNDFRRIHLV